MQRQRFLNNELIQQSFLSHPAELNRPIFCAKKFPDPAPSTTRYRGQEPED